MIRVDCIMSFFIINKTVIVVFFCDNLVKYSTRYLAQ